MRTFLIHKQKPFKQMNTTNHTPGPWYIAHHTEIDGGQSIDIRHCCDIPPAAPEIHQVARLPKNALGDANLISAAPDMIQALQAICDAFGDQDSLLIDQCKAALAKAKGETL